MPKKLNDIIFKTAIVSIPIAVAAWGFYPWYHIRKNLEPEAVYCGVRPNLALDNGIKKPMMVNRDTDKNGKYESIILYKDDIGERIYQEVKKTELGTLTLGEPRSYDR